jgi:hypothetical protein
MEINLQDVLKFWFISDLPHRLMEDDVYKDMHIPKGSLVFGNIWYVLLLMFYFGVSWLAALFSIHSITHYAHLILHATGRCRAMKRYIRMLPLSVLNGSWYQLHLRWNAR